MLVYVLLLAAATPGEVKYDESAPIRTPIKRVLCKDGTMARGDETCRDISPEDGPTKEVLPIPTLRTLPKYRNNPRDWVTIHDYPSRSLSREEEGVSSFRAEISPDGRVSACTITASSGWPALDFATCNNITRRARFDPALDDDGNPTISYYSSTVTWNIPADPSYALQGIVSPLGPQAIFGTHIEIPESDYPLEALEKGWRGRVQIVLTISSEGSVTACAVQTGTGHELLDNKACELASKWIFLPARDAAGAAIVGTTTHEFGWHLPDAWKNYQRTGLYPKKPLQ